MHHSDFRIGLEFWMAGRRWRCTDVGSRVVVAIRVDTAGITTIEDGLATTRAAEQPELEAKGWFAGPPYTLAETVIDENDMEACSLEPEGPYEPQPR